MLGYQFRKTHERAVAAIVVFRETVLCIFFPAVAFFARLQWPRVYNRLKLGKWGLGHGQLCCSIFCINRLIFTRQGLVNRISKTGNDFCHADSFSEG